MSKKATWWSTVGFTLSSVWIAHVSGYGLIAWVCGFAGIAILVLVKAGLFDNTDETKKLTPSAEEIHRAAIANIERQNAEREQEIERLVAYFQEERYRRRPTASGGLRYDGEPIAAEGEDPLIVREAWQRFLDKEHLR